MIELVKFHIKFSAINFTSRGGEGLPFVHVIRTPMLPDPTARGTITPETNQLLLFSRVPCGGGYDQYKETNPLSCLSDPTCCYDYSLAWMRSLLGPGFMRGTPVCHYGATSNQWK